MLAKDVDLVLGFAHRRGAAVPLTEALETVLSETIEAGHGDDDMMALFLELRRRARLGALSPAGEEPS
jgi:3-hydroxyisobutyrate dehydrogenase-like beta-hydroxyacid dehydrogenase